MSNQTQPICLVSPASKTATIPIPKQYFERSSDSCDNEFKQQFSSLKHADCETTMFSLQKKEGQERQSEDQYSSNSQFQFSEEIMLNNIKKQTRMQKQQTRLPLLQIFEWLMKTTAVLKLSKQVFYRAIIIFRKFILVQTKLKSSIVNHFNARLYGFASLLLANKTQSIDGNFLNGKTTLIDGVVKIDKKKVIQCELYILKILNYSTPIKTLITESIIKIIRKWNAITQVFNLNVLSFDLTNTHSQYSIFQHQVFLRQFLYLIDYVMMRNFTAITLKGLDEIEQQTYYQLHLANILYNLCSQSLRSINKRQYTCKFSKAYQILVQSLNPNSSKIDMFFRRSHLVRKKVRQIDNIFRSLYQKQYQKEKINPEKQQFQPISIFKLFKNDIGQFGDKGKFITHISEPNQVLKNRITVNQSFENSRKIIKNSDSNQREQLVSSKSRIEKRKNIITQRLQRLINSHDIRQFQLRQFVDVQRYHSLFQEKDQMRKNNGFKYVQ